MFYYAIVTKYLPANNRKGARIVATSTAGNKLKVTLDYDYAISATDNHTAAARAFVEKHFAHRGMFHGACLENGKYVFVMTASQRSAGRSIHEFQPAFDTCEALS